MILNNYKAFNNFYNKEPLYYYYSTAGELKPSKMIDTSGNAVSALCGINMGSTTDTYTKLYDSVFSKSSLFVALGTGTTAPTAEDYNLNADITNSLSNIQYNRTIKELDDFSLVVTINIVGFNHTQSDIIVSEYGIIKHVPQTNLTHSSFSSNYKSVLFSRDVLTQPITLEAGKGFSLTVTWEES